MATEGGGQFEHGTGISMEELSATPAWKSLRPSIKRILSDALQSRDLKSAVRNSTVGVSSEVQQMIVQNLAVDRQVQSVAMLWVLGVAPEADTTAKEPVTVEIEDRASPETVKTASVN